MSSLFTPVILVIASTWILDVADSFSTPVRVAREVQGERVEARLSGLPAGEFHLGSADAALALSSLARHHPEGRLNLTRAAAALASGKTLGDMDGHLHGEHHLMGHSGQGHLGGELEGNADRSFFTTGGKGVKAISGGIDGHMGHESTTSEEKKALAFEVLRHMSMHNSKSGVTAGIPSGGLHVHAIDGLGGQEGKAEISHFGGTHIAGGELTGGIHGKTQAPQADPPSSGHSISSAHAGAIGGSVVGMEHLGGGRLHHTPTGHTETHTGVVTGGPGITFGGEQEIVGELLNMWSKIGGPEMLGKITAMGLDMYGAGAGALPALSPHSPPPRALPEQSTGTMGGALQGGAGHAHGLSIPVNGGNAAVNYSGASTNTSQPTEVVYVMMMPGAGETFKGTHATGSVSASGGRNAVLGQLPLAYGRGGYQAYNTAGTYKMAQGAGTPGRITYTAIPVGSVSTRGYSVQGRPTFYGGTGRRGGSTYMAWPLTYGMAASRPYSMVAYTAVPAGQVVTTRAQQGVMRPSGTAPAAYYTLQGGRTAATTQQRPAAGVTYAALPAVVVPAQTYKVASG